MTLPTQTWRVSASYPVTVAGASITMTEILVGIKAMLDAEDVLGNNYWTYCHYATGSDNIMLLKRKGSPGGVLGTFRAAIFGGSNAPTAANMHFNNAAAANVLYVASSEDHNSDTPTASYTASAALSGKYNQGTRSLATLTGFTSTSGTRVMMLETDEMCSIWLYSTATIQSGIHMTFGRIVERAVDGAGLWGHFSNKDVLAGTEAGYEAAAGVSAFPALDNASAAVAGGVWDTSLTKGIGRVQYTPATSLIADALQDDTGGTAIVMPLLCGSKSAAGATAVFCIGVLRQIRISIRHQGRLALRDVSNNVKGYLINAGFSAHGRGLFYDQSP